MVQNHTLKILFISTEYPPHPDGGVGSYVACTARALTERGHEVHVLCCVADQEKSDYCDQGVHIHRRGQWTIRGIGRLLAMLKAPITYRCVQTGLSSYFEYLRLGIKFDVIEAPDTRADGWVFAAIRSKPLVVQIHSITPWTHRLCGVPDTRDLLWRFSFEYFTLRRAHNIVTAADQHLRALEEVGWRGLNVDVVPHTIDWQKWHNVRPVRDTSPNVLYLGRLDKGKAPEILAEAVSLVRKDLPAATASFAGRVADSRDGLSYLEWMKKSVGDVSGCRFLGQVPRHEVTSIMADSRVLAMPSWSEIFPMAALEAMSAGRPVVVTETSGLAQLIKEAEAGFVVPTGDPKAFAQALLPLLSDVELAERMGRNGRDLVQNVLHPDKIAARRESVYRKAVHSFKHGDPKTSDAHRVPVKL